MVRINVTQIEKQIKALEEKKQLAREQIDARIEKAQIRVDNATKSLNELLEQKKILSGESEQ